MAVGQVAINNTSATLIVAERASRSKLRLLPEGQVYIGNDSSVTQTTGYLLQGGPEFELETGAAVYAIHASSSAAKVSFAETYD